MPSQSVVDSGLLGAGSWTCPAICWSRWALACPRCRRCSCCCWTTTGWRACQTAWLPALHCSRHRPAALDCLLHIHLRSTNAARCNLGDIICFLNDDERSLEIVVQLDISNNKLETLPANMGAFRKIQRINCSNNFLRKVPSSFGRLPLKELDLRCASQSPQELLLRGSTDQVAPSNLVARTTCK